MNLQTYIDTSGCTQKSLAEAISRTPGPHGKRLSATQGLVSQWCLGKLRVTAERAIQIERATNGAVARHDLRPDIFPRAAA